MTPGKSNSNPGPSTLPSYALILNATDGSAASWSASLHAVALAQRLGAHLLVVYVIDEKLLIQTGLYLTGGLLALHQEGEQATGAVVGLAREHHVPATALLVRGRPGDAIVSLAREKAADMIVLGATGKSALERVLLGSVSEHVLRRAECLVCIQQAHEPQAGAKPVDQS